jgi:hypothetical protein
MEVNKRNILAYQKRFGKTAKKRQKEYLSEEREFEVHPNLLYSCYNAWNSLSQLRKDIRRNEEFVFGDQWADKVYDYKSDRTMTERQLLIEQGLQPSQYNIIRGIIRSIYGVYASSKTLPNCVAQKEENQADSEVLTATLHALYRKNELRKLTGAELIQMLLSGIAVTKNHYVNRDGDSDIANDYIDIFTFFINNNMKDPRYKDCTLVGCFYDLPVDDIAGQFCKGSRQRAAKIRDLYSNITNEDRYQNIVETFTEQRMEKDFFIPGIESSGLGRVIECWRKESLECFWVHDHLTGEYYPDYSITETGLKAENAKRIDEQSAMGVAVEDMLLKEYEWGNNNIWKYYYLTPYGEILDSGINPFWHDKPPFVFELHDFFVGKIYPFVKDLIDANKQVNKLSAISELLTRYSAKNMTLIPVESIASEDGYGYDFIKKEMTSYDAVLPYKAKGMGPGHKPDYVNTVAQAFTPLNVVNMYLQLSEKVSSVYGALQGQQPTAGTPAQMYAQQSQNSATSLNGVFDAIRSFRMRGDKMNVQLMQQFYKDKRWIFDKSTGKKLLWDPDRVRNIDTEITIVENTDTPAYRLMVNEVLMQLKQFDGQNLLDLKGLIEMGEWPFKDKLIDYLNKREQAAMEAATNAQAPQQMPLPEEVRQGLSQYQFPKAIQEQFAELPEDAQQMVLQNYISQLNKN